MQIATFGPTTAWQGLHITFSGRAFALENHGPITAGDVMEYDRQGHLVWESEGTRAWVGSRAAGGTPPAAGRPLEGWLLAARRGAAYLRSAGQRLARVWARTSAIKRTLYVAISALLIANLVLLLAVVHVIHLP